MLKIELWKDGNVMTYNRPSCKVLDLDDEQDIGHLKSLHTPSKTYVSNKEEAYKRYYTNLLSKKATNDTRINRLREELSELEFGVDALDEEIAEIHSIVFKK